MANPEWQMNQQETGGTSSDKNLKPGGERSADKVASDPFRERLDQEYLLTSPEHPPIFDSSSESVPRGETEASAGEHPITSLLVPLKKLKGVIHDGKSSVEVTGIKKEIVVADSNKDLLTGRKFLNVVGGLRDSIDKFLVSSKKYTTFNKMSPLKPGIFEYTSTVDEFFAEKAELVKEKKELDKSVDLQRINTFFDGGLMFEEISVEERKIVKSIIENVYGRGLVVFDIVKRNVPIPNHQKVKFISELSNLKL